ncbi:hypothetical protein DYB25_004422 [Aphanomyces astaci]|uniref:PX domain-containing protein n=3 Tax=Aphanomyces astaci TaxID=112090 RepID=A0A397BJ85_APHAT|nr:hypothetical protein DYB25_004422 [Aphanomyces astaci]RHY21000.1 hypothetical protein DYB36_011606 [Aphanomyces astaci]RHY39576.1 hypothetical protein DYB30_011742 [Aphanomyces astaci]RHY40829.1 hypothetical protein DYB34_011614 [Aphanomyces astaci]RHY50493.1 hypothetical protein DYB38_009381 [Aphanomyces astaci]
MPWNVEPLGRNSCKSIIPYVVRIPYSNLPHPVVMSLVNIRSSVVDAKRDGNHTEYAIRIQTHDDDIVVYRRYSAFVQLQKYVHRHLFEGQCCGGKCLLESFLTNVFETEFPNANFLTKNSAKVVQERVYFLSDFLQLLQDALAKCPPRIIQRCEGEGCKVSKLLKSFLGIVSPNPAHV